MPTVRLTIPVRDNLDETERTSLQQTGAWPVWVEYIGEPPPPVLAAEHRGRTVTVTSTSIFTADEKEAVARRLLGVLLGPQQGLALTVGKKMKRPRAVGPAGGMTEEKEVPR